MNTLDKQLIDKIIFSFTGLYGARFSEFLNADELNLAAWRYEWGEGLKGLTEAHIDVAIQKYRSSENKWPPTLGEFKRAALRIPSAVEIANGGGGKIGKVIRNEIGDTSSFKRLTSAQALKRVESLYDDYSCAFIRNELFTSMKQNPLAIGHGEAVKQLEGGDDNG